MSTQKTKGYNLPSLQKRILLYLAETEPQTINATAKAIGHQYKASWNSFDKLKEKGLIKEAGVKSHHGRDYPRFWLSNAGVFMALLEGASNQDLLNKTVKAYPDDEVLQFVLEMAPFTGLEGYRIGLSAVLAKGRLEESDAATIMLTQMEKDLSTNQFNQVLELLKKHPAQYKELNNQIEQLTKLMHRLKKLI